MSSRRSQAIGLLFFVSWALSGVLGRLASADSKAFQYDFPSFAPYSEFIEFPESGLTAPFCSEWNPDFPYRGGPCCAKVPRRGTNSGGFCPAMRARGDFCGEMTEDQSRYLDQARAGKLGDVIELIKRDQGRSGPQSYCSPNNGFLAWGRPIIETASNRIALKSPHRCTFFGTDGMVGMLEWVGRKIGEEFSAQEHSGVRLLVGDVSAPRGGCLKGSGGRRGHSSHMTGQDVDIGFISSKPGLRTSLVFQRQFDPKPKWWMLKQLFHNPFACVKVVFVDRSLISKLRKVAQDDPDWAELSSRIRHVRNHRNHFHVRIGDRPGAPGCVGDTELDEEEEG